jgi:hypothetical protein
MSFEIKDTDYPSGSSSSSLCYADSDAEIFLGYGTGFRETERVKIIRVYFRHMQLVIHGGPKMYEYVTSLPNGWERVDRAFSYLVHNLLDIGRMIAYSKYIHEEGKTRGERSARDSFREWLEHY